MTDYNEYSSGYQNGGYSAAPGHFFQTGINPASYQNPCDYQNAYGEPALFYQSQQFWKGMAIGAIAAVFVTNEGVQKAVMKGAIKLYDMVQGGVNELKEKFEDVQAEVRQKEGAEE
ncbi:MAG: hypothetical protein R2941_22925 [Desulfobacterales bacterium]